MSDVRLQQSLRDIDNTGIRISDKMSRASGCRTLWFTSRGNSIYYICGLTWKKCALIQIICDLFVVILSAMLTLIALLIFSKISDYIVLQRTPFLISVAIAAVMYLIAEILGILQFKKNNVAEIVERVK